MVKKLVLNCKFPTGVAPVNFFIGNPSDDSHPIEFQSEWLASEYGGSVPSEIMDSMEKLHQISIKNKLNFEDLCEHVFKEVNSINSINSEKATRTRQLNHISKIDPMAAQQNSINGGNVNQPQQSASQQPQPTKDSRVAPPVPKKPINNKAVNNE